ncbi:MAG: hypothetical protein ACRDF4_08330, partial [Rhabdochlamydiaceae bacterium]
QNDAQLVERIMNPDKYGFYSRDAGSNVSLGRHVDGMTNSKYVAASKHPFGASRFKGKRYWINTNIVKKHGSTIHDTEPIANALGEVKVKKANKLQYQIERLQKILRGEPSIEDIEKFEKKVQDAEESLQKTERHAVLSIKDREVAVEAPSGTSLAIPPSAVKGGFAQFLTTGLHVVQFGGIILTLHDLGQAAHEAYQQHSLVPLEKESARQVGGWGGSAIGNSITKKGVRLLAKILKPTVRSALEAGGREGALEGVEIGGDSGGTFLIETGPGAVIGAAVGAAIFGAIGYFGGDYIANYLDKLDKENN